MAREIDGTDVHRDRDSIRRDPQQERVLQPPLLQRDIRDTTTRGATLHSGTGETLSRSPVPSRCHRRWRHGSRSGAGPRRWHSVALRPSPRATLIGRSKRSQGSSGSCSSSSAPSSSTLPARKSTVCPAHHCSTEMTRHVQRTGMLGDPRSCPIRWCRNLMGHDRCGPACRAGFRPSSTGMTPL